MSDEWSDVIGVGPHQLQFFGCVWSSELSIINASLYPEILQVDTTAKTNAYNYPFFFLVGSNSNNKSENWLTGILPNLKTGTFVWLFVKMLSLFVGSTTLKALEVVISDGSMTQIAAINYAISSGIFWKDAIRLLCFWHAICLPILNELGFLGEETCYSLQVRLKELATRCVDLRKVDAEWD